MFDKLTEVEKRFEEVNDLVCQPEIVTDQEQYTKLMKEIKQLTPVVEKFREYKKAKETNEESRAMLDEGGLDSDFAEMVKEEFEQSKEDISVFTENIISLRPKRLKVVSLDHSGKHTQLLPILMAESFCLEFARRRMADLFRWMLMQRNWKRTSGTW